MTGMMQNSPMLQNDTQYYLRMSSESREKGETVQRSINLMQTHEGELSA